MPPLEQMHWAQCIEYNVLLCLLCLKWERERKPVSPQSPESTEGTHCSHLCWHRSFGSLIAPDREALFFIGPDNWFLLILEQTTDLFYQTRQQGYVVKLLIWHWMAFCFKGAQRLLIAVDTNRWYWSFFFPCGTNQSGLQKFFFAAFSIITKSASCNN